MSRELNQLTLQDQPMSPNGAQVQEDSETSDLRQLAAELHMGFVDLHDVQVDLELLASFSVHSLFRHCVLPISIADGVVQVASPDPFQVEWIDELATLSGRPIEPVLSEREQILSRLKELLGVGGATVGDLLETTASDHLGADVEEGVDEDSQSSSVIKLVNELLAEAVARGASDVHIEPDEDGLVIRFRVDGILRVQSVPAEIRRFRAAIVSRLKIMAGLNIAEKRLPQDGRIKLVNGGREIDVRISVIPMLHGEGVVMRLLDASQAMLDIEHLQMPAAVRNVWDRLIRKPHGMVLVTGPTGSGKTTTLYSSLAAVRSSKTKIVTIEDPVEYNLKGIGQIQVHSQIGLTFAASLRSVLRHDPDVVLIGEIRDSETAISAVQASLTGHLVLSTLHTNDACSAVTRLVDMGIEPYLVASVLQGVLAQRLVRRLCMHCRTPVVMNSQSLPADFSAAAGKTIYQATGCRQCYGSGYAGRVALFELLIIDAAMRELCTRSASAGTILERALSTGMQTLRQSGWQRVLDGLTTIDEVVRVCAEDLATPTQETEATVMASSNAQND